MATKPPTTKAEAKRRMLAIARRATRRQLDPNRKPGCLIQRVFDCAYSCTTQATDVLGCSWYRVGDPNDAFVSGKITRKQLIAAIEAL